MEGTESAAELAPEYRDDNAVAASRPAWRVLKVLLGIEGLLGVQVAATRPVWRVLKDALLSRLCLAQKIHLRDFSCFPPHTPAHEGDSLTLLH